MASSTLRELGWKPCFDRQVSLAESAQSLIVRVAAHFGSEILCLGEQCEFLLPTSLITAADQLAVGDWLLLEPESRRLRRRLDRESILERRAAGAKVQTQLLAANVDTIFVVSSCNPEFKASRMERYLAVVSQAGAQSVVVLTKADTHEDPDSVKQQVMGLKQGVIVEAVDARDRQQVATLEVWCGSGQTVALVGSSGVGKSTLAMSLGAGQLRTSSIREDDARGRHTTTTRMMHRLAAGGLLIDMPGMRELQLPACEDGVEEVFDDVASLAQACRFRDCTHQGEPGCAVLAAIEGGEMEPRRLKNYVKLKSEQARNAQSLAERRAESRKIGQFYKSIQASKRRRREDCR